MSKNNKFELKKITNLPTYKEKINQIKQHVNNIQSNIKGGEELFILVQNSLESTLTHMLDSNVKIKSINENEIHLYISNCIIMIIEFTEESTLKNDYTIKISNIQEVNIPIILTEDSYKLIGKLHNFAPEIVQCVKFSKRKLDKITLKISKIKNNINEYIDEQIREYNINVNHLKWQLFIADSNYNDDSEITRIIIKQSGKDIIYIKDGMVHIKYKLRNPVKLNTYIKKFFDKNWSFNPDYTNNYHYIPHFNYKYFLQFIS